MLHGDGSGQALPAIGGPGQQARLWSPDGDARLVKFVTAATKVLDEDKGTVSAVFSTEAKDRDGDIIRQSFWDLKTFRTHNVLLSSHNYRGLTNQIGELSVSVDRQAKELKGVATYYKDAGNQEADWGWELAKRGKAAYSVGFVPDMDRAVKLEDSSDWWPNYEFKGQELLEISQVTIPSNPEALQLAKGFAGVHPGLREYVETLEHAYEVQDFRVFATLGEAQLQRGLERLEAELTAFREVPQIDIGVTEDMLRAFADVFHIAVMQRLDEALDRRFGVEGHPMAPDAADVIREALNGVH
jgi:hypothetical protein